MKKLLCVLLCMFLLCSFAGCNGAEDPDAETTTSATTTATTAPPAPANPASDFEYILFPEGGYCAIEKYIGTAKDVVIPDTIEGLNVAALGCGTFNNNDNVVSVYIPDTVIIIWQSAFYSCDNLVSVRFGSGLEHILEHAFFKCSSLEKVILPNGLTTVESEAFAECASLKEIFIPNTITTLSSYCFANNDALTTITFEEGLKDIGGFATFQGTVSLETVTIPASVKQINGQAFSACHSLKSVLFVGDAPKVVGDNVFGNPRENPDILIYYPKDAKGWNDTELSEYTLVEYTRIPF